MSRWRDRHGPPSVTSVFHESEWYHVYCFADPANAEQFRVRFGGEPFNPDDRGRGANWARWRKPQRRAANKPPA